MKMKQISFAFAALSFSALANALTPVEINNAFNAGNLDQAWISGASAPTKTVYEGWAKGCVPGTNSIYSSVALTSGGNPTSNVPGALGNFVAYACTRGTRASVLYHTLDGGSLNAYSPHTIGTKLARLRFLGEELGSATGCSTTVNNYVDSTNAQNNATVYKVCKLAGAALPGTGPTADSNLNNAAAVAADNKAPSLPVGGFSDVEASLFSTTIGGGDVSQAGIEGDAFLTQGFGVAVSVPLYRRLQQVQGLADVNDTTFDVANAPSLTKTQIASILQDGGRVRSARTWVPILGGTSATTPQQVLVHRRVDTSGTQAASNAFFLGSPCLQASGLNPASTDSASGSGASLRQYDITLHSGSGNVKAAITTASNNVTSNPNLSYAIGVLSLENDYRNEASAANAGYRYIKIDGVHPEEGDVANARTTISNNKYQFAFELKNFVANTASGFGATIVDEITAALSNPADSAQCAVLPRGIVLSASSPASACPGTTSRTAFTKAGNNCSPWRLR